MTDTVGWRDAVKKIPADVDTAYAIGSTMKAMIAACCGILVAEKKLKWDDKLSKHLNFRFHADPVVEERATISDALSHSTGIAQLDLTWYGASGKNLVEPQDVLHVVSHLPVGAAFRSEWSYCNYMYVLMGRIIDQVSGKSWPDFLQERLLQPLGMSRSKLSREDFEDDNVAEPHYVKDDGTPGALPRPDLSSDTLMGPAGCLLSTVPDMLKWVKECLHSIQPHDQKGSTSSILEEMGTITAHHAQVAHSGLFENTYGFGWSRLSMPSPMYGFMSSNGTNITPTLGEESKRRLMLYHGGQVTGYLTTLCIFPETQSAIVVLSNSQALGDASDWTARAIMQELFELQPVADVLGQAQLKAKEARSLYINLMKEYNDHRGDEKDFKSLEGRFGIYRNHGLKLFLRVQATSKKGKAGEFFLNGMESQHHYLEPFKGSTFGFPPSSREEQESRCMVDYVSYEQLLLTCHDEESGVPDSISWVMQPGLDAIVFERERSVV